MVTLRTLEDRRLQILALAERYRTGEVRVFGSVARGEAKEDSDVDLLIIEKVIVNQRSEMARIGAELATFCVPVDVMVMTAERFEETKNVIGGIAYPAHKYGKVIYEAA